MSGFNFQTVLVPCLLAIIMADLMCYDGKQRWDPEPVINNVTLTKCEPQHKCCFMISSLDGTEFGCYDDCPSTTHYSCGPDPKLGIQDVYYCYCQSHEDANCKPYLENAHHLDAKHTTLRLERHVTAPISVTTRPESTQSTALKRMVSEQR